MTLYLISLSVVGLALLLSGMKVMEAALASWAGDRMALAVARSTSTPLRGFALGTASSALLQSGTAVTLLTISLVNSGILPFARCFGILLGTNVGTCLTTELMSLELHRYGLPLLGAGTALWLLSLMSGEWRALPPMPRRIHDACRFGGAVLAGFALLLAGFALLRTMGPLLQRQGTFAHLMDMAAQQPALGVLGGAVLTALIHSGAAVVGMSMGFVSADAMSPDTAVAIVLGANVGTCATGLLVSLGGSRGGKLVALSQIALNVGGVLLFYPLRHELLAAAAYVAPGNAAAQIAHAQTIFNVACSLLALPLAYLIKPPAKPVAPGAAA
ncbi:Na/Pi symporter [Cohnella rhizosphaerae]|uniref:Na/Pi symporter n=1 Tax=Cohnella rhizosphaerae TaxID=1457232 RepID=A0A9X4KXF0_9BACL|nr:Na/Pi symporter [Cohnella rhizosphaerae]MDG0812131.1 Na/Pi symporter [Cohnella rhizosphaerae]